MCYIDTILFTMCFEPPGLCGALRRTSAMASSISLSLAFRKVLAAAPIMKNNDSQHGRRYHSQKHSNFRPYNNICIFVQQIRVAKLSSIGERAKLEISRDPISVYKLYFRHQTLK